MVYQMIRSPKQLLFVKALREFEKNRQVFTIPELVALTGYTENSVRKYINEKLKGVYLYQINDKEWQCEGLSKVSDDDFLQLMSQSLKVKSSTPELRFHKKLMKRSLDAFTLALEVYNRPSLENRVEAFCILAVNAWELMLKAELIKKYGFDFVLDKKGRSISITDSLNKVLPQNNAVRKNLETLIELRDSAIHLLIPELQPELSRLFQSSVLNYQHRYTHEMGNSPLAGQSVGMLSLVVDGPKSEIAVIKDSYGELTAKSVTEFLTRFNKNVAEVNSLEFSIPMDYRLTLSRNKNLSDLVLSTGSKGEKAIIIRETKDPDLTHPYYQSGAISQINLRQKIKINAYSFQAVLAKHKIKEKRCDMHFQIDGRHRYSEKFIDWFVLNLKQPNWLNEALQTMRVRKQKK